METSVQYIMLIILAIKFVSLSNLFILTKCLQLKKKTTTTTTTTAICTVYVSGHILATMLSSNEVLRSVGVYHEVMSGVYQFYNSFAFDSNSQIMYFTLLAPINYCKSVSNIYTRIRFSPHWRPLFALLRWCTSWSAKATAPVMLQLLCSTARPRHPSFHAPFHPYVFFVGLSLIDSY